MSAPSLFYASKFGTLGFNTPFFHNLLPDFFCVFVKAEISTALAVMIWSLNSAGMIQSTY